MKNLLSQNPIRVLRSCYQSGLGFERKTTFDFDPNTLKSLKPTAGVRYDGLYRVTGYSVSVKRSGTGRWYYKYFLERLAGQMSLDAILSIPSDTLMKQAVHEKAESTGPGDGATNGLLPSPRKEDEEYWGVNKRILDAGSEKEEAIVIYARQQRNLASAAVERLKRDSDL